MDSDKEKRHGSSGSGKSPTKFMERPGSKTGKKKDEEGTEQSHPEFINDDLDALESQEKDEDIGTSQQQGQGWNKPKEKGDQKPDQRKFQEPEKRDSSPDDAGDCACP
jgi:hypothetical protein